MPRLIKPSAAGISVTDGQFVQGCSRKRTNAEKHKIQSRNGLIQVDCDQELCQRLTRLGAVTARVSKPLLPQNSLNDRHPLLILSPSHLRHTL